MSDQEIRAALDRHWAASDANDLETEHDIYLEDAVLEYPQSGERIRGRRTIQVTRTVQPSEKRFAVRRIVGSGDLWITEYILLYDGKPSFTVSIMEFRGNREVRRAVVAQRPFFSDAIEACEWVAPDALRHGRARPRCAVLRPGGGSCRGGFLTAVHNMMRSVRCARRAGKGLPF